jgi:hypothetical protein
MIVGYGRAGKAGQKHSGPQAISGQRSPRALLSQGRSMRRASTARLRVMNRYGNARIETGDF